MDDKGPGTLKTGLAGLLLKLTWPNMDGGGQDGGLGGEKRAQRGPVKVGSRTESLSVGQGPRLTRLHLRDQGRRQEVGAPRAPG